MKEVAVITGDMIGSRKVSASVKTKLFADLQKYLQLLLDKKTISRFEMFRGDSFQLIAAKEDALLVLLLVKTYMKSYTGVSKRRSLKSRIREVAGRYDIRVAAGIGKVNLLKKDLSQSDGDAFYLSGESLDKLKGLPYSMMIKTSLAELNDSVEPSMLLLDAVVQKWTGNQSETIQYKLLGLKEDDIAAKLKISQSAVNQRAKAAQWYAVEKLVAYFNRTFKTL